MVKQTNSTWMLAALNAANETILRTISRQELYQRVCDAVVGGDGFAAAAILVAETDGRLRYAAGAGESNEALGALRTSTDAPSAGAQRSRDRRISFRSFVCR
ncbi:hypothetical protein V1282_002816 [Nitrobacteraceae bacterium AZCC 2146]